ncbi:MAG: 5-formyltetrahydrofolate cyclo-ligase [Hyphomicrobiaceae bacterium]|nr:5-formyltetrahydrofolate cyclo-ligase [Hyphomicrobiaceae bacterium]MCC0024155.1 5-formyltetrahydrofolate cyclo-ligase [Hyphomicrobiaceae bacterium]
MTEEEAAQKKAALRQRIKYQRDSLTEAYRRAASQAAAAQFAKYVDCAGKVVALFVPIGSEIDGASLFKTVIAQGGRAALPVVLGEEPMAFLAWDGNLETLIKGLFGTRFPNDRHVVHPDIIVVPLLGFDRRGHRLGWGKGYYDRTIAAMPKRPRTVGLAFAMQEVGMVASEAHDIPLDLIITEKGPVRVTNKDHH